MGAAFQIRKGEKEFLGPRRGVIACAAYYRYREGYSDDLTLDACPVLDF